FSKAARQLPHCDAGDAASDRPCVLRRQEICERQRGTPCRSTFWFAISWRNRSSLNAPVSHHSSSARAVSHFGQHPISSTHPRRTPTSSEHTPRIRGEVPRNQLFLLRPSILLVEYSDPVRPRRQG